ncbi:MAG TPA: toll/interleukin-1 receptor domain-containing protein [Anaerolineales bacterium]|nr:toll/interleukin-1 receptor domain-containing protein [Anaerolineales bacterium]
MPERNRPLKVFLCHASQDKPAVRELYGALRLEGWVDPWLDKVKILPGQNWRTVIEKAVEESDVVIVCLSTQSVSKEGFVQREVKYAYDIALEKPEETIFLIPLRLDDCSVPRGLRSFHWVNYFDVEKSDAYSSLLDALKLRYGQKLKIEEEIALREKERKEREAAEKVEHERAEREVITDPLTAYRHRQKVVSLSDRVDAKRPIYPVYSKDIWDYLVDMPYMPSRSDRDNLAESADDKRRRIWDYFFRIKPEDVGRPQEREINNLKELLDKSAAITERDQAEAAMKRIKQLELEIAMLRQQIPVPPPDETVHNWLREDLNSLRERSLDISELHTRLVNIAEIHNPIQLIGPAELQHRERVPPEYLREVRPDQNRHIGAYRSYFCDAGYIEVLYGLYYLQHIVLADDMFGAYGLFFDFISGQFVAEQYAEVYYKDLVTIGWSYEYRNLPLNDQENVSIENIPTFVLSLASGERITIALVNERYFMAIKERLDVSRENIVKISLIDESRSLADNAIKALRLQIRLHKTG